MREAPPAGPPLWRVHGQVLLSRALVATSFVVGASITHGLAPELLTLLRFVLATVLFLPYVAFAHGIAWPGLRALAGNALISASIVGFFWAMFEALRWTSALNAAALYNLLPAIAAVWAWVLVRERLGGFRLVALVLGGIGALWVVFRGEPERLLALDLNRGDLIFLAGLVAMGLYTPLIRRFDRKEPAAVMTFWTLATGAGWLVLVNNAAIWQTDWAGVEGEVFLGIAYLAVFTTILTFLIMQHATGHIGPTRVASYGYLSPVFVVAVELALGHDLPSAMTWPGLVLVVAATVVLQSGAGRVGKT